MSGESSNAMKKPLAVMKFGGTSVGDAAAIRNVVEIVAAAAHSGALAVVVSAMSGVTNQLLEAATQAEAGNRDRVESIFRDLRARHRAAIGELIRSVPLRGRVNLQVEQIFEEGERLCEGSLLSQQLTPRTRDAISGLGERMSAPIVAAALNERGVVSQAIEATELIRTDSCHGSAEPYMAATRGLCHAQLCPLLEEGVVPVVTGFIGSSEGGVLTTLGRGGSDYSATILGAALEADEVTIWTDVDGLMTADPRLVPDASTIGEISYSEAAELARSGAKVLHPKCLRHVDESGIPIRIRNTFSPDGGGTRITLYGSRSAAKIKGLAVMSETADSSLARVTAVGKNMRDPEIASRIISTLREHSVSLISISPRTSDHSFSFAIAKRDVKRALEILHVEFRLNNLDQQPRAVRIPPASEAWIYATAPGTTSAD
jgi:bifunctional aspartokinase / homoserine dehydrogenase 1